MKEIFISHSSKDIVFINSLNNFLMNLGIKDENIFCSSIQGQDVKTGDRIEEVVRTKLSNSDLIFYIISKNFLESPYCTAEYGAGWVLQEKQTKIIIIKMPDVDPSDLQGFLNSNYKYTELNIESLSAMLDDIVEYTEVPSLKAVDAVKAITTLLNDTKPYIAKIIEEKDMNDEQIQKNEIEALHKSVSNLNIVEKALIAYLYFKDDRIENLNIMDGVVNLLSKKLYIYRLSGQSFNYTFPFTLQPWVLDYIKENNDFKSELKKINEQEILRNNRAFSAI